MTWQEAAWSRGDLSSSEESAVGADGVARKVLPSGRFALSFDPVEEDGPDGKTVVCPIERTLGTLNDQTACGVSGFSHVLYKKLRVGDVRPFIDYFAGNVDVDFTISYNEFVRIAVCSARGIGLDKGGGILRPICIGECLRRFAGRCILAVIRRSGAGTALGEGLQFGADVRGGGDLALH